MSFVRRIQEDQYDVYDNDDVHARLQFFKHLQTITNAIHSTSNIEQIMLDMSQRICELFECERLTLYSVNYRKNAIESKVKTGLSSFKDFALPISEKSVAGYVAMSKQTINLSNVYDEAELKTHSPNLEFLRRVDQRTGFRTKQMMVGPLVHEQSNELLGVLQLINNRNDCQFPPLLEEGFRYLRNTLAVAFAQRLMSPQVIHTKFDSLIKSSILSIPELGLAARAARRKGVDVEEILIDEFEVKPADIGQSLAAYFECGYQPYKADRVRPDALKNFKRAYVEDHHWIVLEENADNLIIMTTDPERVMASRIVHSLFPIAKIQYCVTTQREFQQTVDQFFGENENTITHIEAANQDAIETVTAAETALLAQVRETIANAFGKNHPEFQIDVRSREDKTVSRMHKDGSVQRIAGQVIVDFHVDFLDTGMSASA
ncbi:GAF domain-containing protein [Undibacterium sp. CY18W]|uniref:GAF domain-containing protein n=1 Tax=Undibacterium hunanense TaxID=2762292 RepID=A0ABR6ZSB5_9BURK|nr:GAF domain-containing protein [Undibacterium hunanense]MBC3918771.1 GAF domain-containing protein [Undibacterium hunanense]